MSLFTFSQNFHDDYSLGNDPKAIIKSFLFPSPKRILKFNQFIHDIADDSKIESFELTGAEPILSDFLSFHIRETQNSHRFFATFTPFLEKKGIKLNHFERDVTQQIQLFKIDSNLSSRYYSKQFINNHLFKFYQKIKQGYQVTEEDFNELSKQYVNTYQQVQRSVYGYVHDDIMECLQQDGVAEDLFAHFKYESFVVYKNKTQDEIRDYLFNTDYTESYWENNSCINTNEKYYLLNDRSVIIEKDNIFTPVHPLHIEPLVAQLEFKHVKHEFRKYPMIVKKIVENQGSPIYGFKESNSFEQLLSLKESMDINRNILKSSGISILDLYKENNESIEGVVDDLNKTVQLYKAKQFMKSFLSTKTHYLMTDDNIKIFKDLQDYDLRKKDYHNYIFNNIAYYQVDENTSEQDKQEKLESFSFALKVFKNKTLNHFDESYYLERMKENDHMKNVIFHKDKTILYKVKTPEESLKYGNNTWCISRKNSYQTFFKQYKSEDKYQYFYYDFSQVETKDLMIGITTDKYGKPTDAFDNSNSDYLKNPKLKEIKDLIKKHDPEVVILKNKKRKTIGF